MPSRARLFIGVVILSGLTIVAAALSQWQSDNAERFAVLLALTLAGSAIKVKLPGITGTYSLSFWFVLVAVASLGFSETLALAAAASLVQAYWKPKLGRPSPVQAIFNVANLALSAGAAYALHKALAVHFVPKYELALLSVTIVVYWTVNTGLVSAVLGLLKEGSFRAIWQHWCFLSLPYYVLGSGVAAFVSPAVRHGDWRPAVIVFPFLLLASVWHRLWVRRQVTAAPLR